MPAITVEFYTGPFRGAHGDDAMQNHAFDALASAAEAAKAAGLDVNAGGVVAWISPCETTLLSDI